MTNLILLCVALFQTNTFPYGATDEFGGWSSNYTWNVELTYASETSGVYSVFYSYNAEGSTPTPNGWNGMRWTELNNSPNVYPSGFGPAPRGYYTNSFTNWSTNTIRLPVPAQWDKMFFKLKRVREA